MSEQRMKGKIALVTGSTSGIGEAVAKRLAREGAAVAVLASRDITRAQSVVSEITEAGGRAGAFVGDVRDSGAVKKLLADVESQLGGRVDILVNSAGVYYETPAGTTSDQDIENMIDINFKGTLNTINAVVPGMKEGGFGRIVNISSICAVVGIKDFSLYCATKAAVSMLTRALAGELAPHNININAVAPGNTETSMNEVYRTDPKYREYLQAMEKMTPSNSTFSSPDDIAATVLFCLLPEARAMHGSTLLMDEGLSACL